MDGASASDQFSGTLPATRQRTIVHPSINKERREWLLLLELPPSMMEANAMKFYQRWQG
jgi:hypothetical protein